mmetsp:Transcript_23041/g.69082  ORF Transcript_23041/g.69082 Transcript_23041/m.69082 type:complete len:92 (-) Transcript_23041:39-314(-)
MADSSQDVKPSGDQINLVVVNQTNGQTHFKVKKTTKFAKLITAFCSREGVSEDKVRLLYDGQRLNPNQTPADLDMEDGDQIDARLEQIGGR